jgi:hypothetical protein
MPLESALCTLLKSTTSQGQGFEKAKQQEVNSLCHGRKTTNSRWPINSYSRTPSSGNPTGVGIASEGATYSRFVGVDQFDVLFLSLPAPMHKLDSIRSIGGLLRRRLSTKISLAFPFGPCTYI